MSFALLLGQVGFSGADVAGASPRMNQGQKQVVFYALGMVYFFMMLTKLPPASKVILFSFLKLNKIESERESLPTPPLKFPQRPLGSYPLIFYEVVCFFCSYVKISRTISHILNFKQVQMSPSMVQAFQFLDLSHEVVLVYLKF